MAIRIQNLNLNAIQEHPKNLEKLKQKIDTPPITHFPISHAHAQPHQCVLHQVLIHRSQKMIFIRPNVTDLWSILGQTAWKHAYLATWLCRGRTYFQFSIELLPAVFWIMDWYVRNEIRPITAIWDDGNPPERGVWRYETGLHRPRTFRPHVRGGSHHYIWLSLVLYRS